MMIQYALSEGLPKGQSIKLVALSTSAGSEIDAKHTCMMGTTHRKAMNARRI